MKVCFYLPAEDSVTVQENCLYRPHWKCKVLSLRWGIPYSCDLYMKENLMLIRVQGNCTCDFNLWFKKKIIITPLYLLVISGFSGFVLNLEPRSIKSLNWMYFAALVLDHSKCRSTVEVMERRSKEEDSTVSLLVLHLQPVWLGTKAVWLGITPQGLRN